MDTLPPSLNALLEATPVAEVRTVPRLREQMIFEAACSVGARSGLASRSKEIRDGLEIFAATLDKMSFQPLMTSEGMLPPVIAEARDTVRQEGSKDKRVAGVIYRMVSEARLVMIAPTWRDYLYVGLPMPNKVEMPHQSFYPKTDDERLVWKRAVSECWTAGVSQADAAFNENVSRFERDYLGMVRYKMLAARGMVEGLKVGSEIKPVSGDRNEMVIDDRHIRIIGPGGLIPDVTKWK